MIARNLGIVALLAGTVMAAAWRVQTLVVGPDLPVATSERYVAQSAVDLPAPPSGQTADPWARLLFSPQGTGRQRASSMTPEEGSGTATAAAQLPRLLGIVIQGADRIAIMDVGGKIRRVRENSEINKWMLVRVDSRTVVMRSSDVSQTIMLDQARPNRR